MKFGYARVSAQDLDSALQLDTLKAARCTEIFQEKMTGTNKNRPELQKMLPGLRSGDVVVVWKLDRLARSLKDLVGLVNEMKEKGVEFQSLNDHIDTTTPHGKFTFHLFAAMAEFERDIISERPKAGLTAARARGRVGGRPKGLSQDAEHTAIIAEQLYKEGRLSVKDICRQLSIAKSTFYSYLRHRGVEVSSARKN